MNIYAISTGCYSDYTQIHLTHENKYSKEEFLEICIKALEAAKKKDDYVSCCEDVKNIIIQDFGFKLLDYINCHLFDYSYDGVLPVIN